MKQINVFTVKYVKEKGARYTANEAMSTPEKVFGAMQDLFNLSEAAEEYFYIVCLDTKNKISSVSEVSHGSLNSSSVSPREVFKRALVANAMSIILVHNHPSGDTRPSPEDETVTKKLKECGKLMGIPVVDHIIIANHIILGSYYYSFAQEGIL